jgi:hypothetical protein
MKYRWFVGAGVVAAVLVIAIVLWHKTQGSELSPRDLADRLASGKQIDLPGGTFKPTSPAADYFALPAGPQRVAYLDKLIQMQQETQKKIASGEIKVAQGAMRPPVQEGSKAGDSKDEKPGTSVEQSTSADGSQKRVSIRLNSDDLSPSFRGQMQEFASALRARRKELGLDPDAPIMIIRTDVHSASK